MAPSGFNSVTILLEITILLYYSTTLLLYQCLHSNPK